MQIFPAIDLRGGQVVRLYQGDYDKETVYAQDPCAVARDFIAAGAGYLHVVDLDGAKDGTLANFDTIAAIAGQGGLYIEVGGGIRDEDRIRRYLDLGVGRCILGTIAVKDFDFTERMAQTYGDRIAVGVDARGVADGAGEIVLNSIDTDGVKQGFDLEMLDALASRVSVPIIASGGAGKMEDFAQLFTHPGIDAGLAASIFHTRQVDIKELKHYLRAQGVEMRI